VNAQLSKFEADMLAELPKMQRLANKLCKNPTEAEDLVQETVYRALKYRHQFKDGTVIGAWMWTIMRNYFTGQRRKVRREIEDPNGEIAQELLVTLPEQFVKLEAQETLELVQSLSDAFRTPLLMAADGASYREMVSELLLPEGTVKSRIFRGREMLGAR
jgi:RNA polymerase sigma-70 factor (ECF subfamily)